MAAATQVKRRRGSQAEVDLFTPAVGEIVVSTTEKELILGDGATPGGIPLPKKSNTVLSFDTLAIAIANEALKEGFEVKLKERTAGNGGGATWKVVLASSVTPNTFDIVQCTGVPTLALVLRVGVFAVATQFGDARNSATINAAKTYGVANNIPIHIPEGTWGITEEIDHLTGDLFASRPNNGIHIFGDGIGKTILLADDAFNGNVIKLDGNMNNTDDNFNPVTQEGNNVNNLSIVGSGQTSGNPLSNGMFLRANLRCSFSNIMIKEFTQHGLIIDGTSVATKDDADTTSMCTFTDFYCHENNSYGLIGDKSRTSTLLFQSCEFRNNTNDGMRLAYSGLRVLNCSFAGNGQDGNNTGGFTTIVPATGAISRGLDMLGCETENNYNHEVRLDYCDGFSITGSRFGSFKQDAVAPAGGKRVFNLGKANIGNLVQGVISGCQIASLGSGNLNTGVVYVYDIGEDVTGLEINNVPVTDNDLSPSYRNYTEFLIDPAARGVTKNGAELTVIPSKPAFSASITTQVSDVPQITGDGTVYTAASLFGSASDTEHYNSVTVAGGVTTKHFIAGVFTVPEQGVYEFSVRWPLTGFDGTETEALARITSGSIVEILEEITLTGLSLGVTDKLTIGGTTKLFLAKGETVNFHLIVSGSASKNIDIDRSSGARFQVSGNAI